MQRLVIVYNPRSSKHALVEKQVLAPARKLAGFALGKYEVKPTDVDDNAAKLAQILQDDDLVIAAGGDGTATIALNGALLSEKKLSFAALPFGNFNDMARTFGCKDFEQVIRQFEAGSLEKLYPLEAMVDGEHYRYAACYFTFGMFAESTELFDAPKTRGKLKKGRKGLMFSLKQLVGWYFKNRRRDFVPGDVQIGDVPQNKMKMLESGRTNIPRGARVTDILCVNGKTVARLMKGGEYWKNPDEFVLAKGRLSNVFRLFLFMTRSVLKRVPGEIVNRDSILQGIDGKQGTVKIDFSGATEMEVQAEGEYKRLKLTKVVISKVKSKIKVVVA